jgi:hypothetical protein
MSKCTPENGGSVAHFKGGIVHIAELLGVCECEGLDKIFGYAMIQVSRLGA